MTRNVGVILVCLVFQFSTCAIANDSIAHVGAGGLELLKTDHIQMVSEFLEISTSKIRVNYHYLNTSDKAIATTVAFPMPAFSGAASIDGTEINQRPIDSFRILVNGTEVPVNINRVFLMNDIDVTEILRKIGLSVDQIFDANFSCMNVGDSESDSELLDSACTITTEQRNFINKMYDNKIYQGAWKIQETAYWEQTFPAGKEIEIFHEYSPFVGYGYGIAKDATKICFDNGTSKALGKQIKKGEFHIIHNDVEYILGTGRNWKGPIKNFTLVIKKNSPDETVSLCFPGKPKRTSPLTIEYTHTNFVPQDSLFIAFIRVLGGSD